MITVHNLHHGKPAGRCEFVGRTRALGNRFVIGVDGGRAEVIVKYRQWLWRELKTGQGRVHDQMRALLEQACREDVRLLCYCAPLPCHADVIQACLQWMAREEGRLIHGWAK